MWRPLLIVDRADFPALKGKEGQKKDIPGSGIRTQICGPPREGYELFSRIFIRYANHYTNPGDLLIHSEEIR